MIKVGLLFQDRGFNKLDLRYPENGNGGVGGTQYCFLMLMRYLKKNYSNLDVYVFHYSENIFPKGVKSYLIRDEKDAIEVASNLKIDMLIVKNGIDSRFINIIEQNKINTIVWSHNYIFPKEIELINKCEFIKKVVFVGKEQYDRYLDHDIISKSIYIYNMFNSSDERYYRRADYNLNVTYTGSLVPSKGFHIIAREWKKIIKSVPTAKLYVIGNGKLYNRNICMGKYGIAAREYENKIMPYLTNQNGEILDSVIFCGVLGEEKVNIYNNTAVGIINPTGRTETFGLSAVEMEACGIPIVTKGVNGLFDTVQHNKTGLLSYNRYAFRKNIIKLLNDKELNNKLGKQAKEYIKKFNPDQIIKEWYDLIESIFYNKDKNIDEEYTNLKNNYKWIRVANKKIKKYYIFSKLPSLIEIEYKCKALVLNLLNR